MTVFGIDMSDYDAGRGPEDIPAMFRDGIRLLTHKATEGTSDRHSNYGRIVTAARDAGIPVLGAYHVVRSGPPVDAQVAYMLAYLDQATPWWRTHPNFMLQVDLERWSYDAVPATVGAAFAATLERATGHYVVIYASHGQYGDSIPGGHDLWNANYPSSRAGHYSTLYPGDGGVGWTSYSGRTPVFWQYTSSGTVGSQPGCDINAYRGTLDQLLALTSNQGADMATVDDVYNLLKRSLNGFTDKGQPTENLVGTWVSGFQQGQTVQQQQLAAIAAKLGAPVQAVLTSDQLATITAAIISHPDTPLGDADKPAIEAAVTEAFAKAFPATSA